MVGTSADRVPGDGLSTSFDAAPARTIDWGPSIIGGRQRPSPDRHYIGSGAGVWPARAWRAKMSRISESENRCAYSSGSIPDCDILRS